MDGFNVPLNVRAAGIAGMRPNAVMAPRNVRDALDRKTNLSWWRTRLSFHLVLCEFKSERKKCYGIDPANHLNRASFRLGPGLALLALMGLCSEWLRFSGPDYSLDLMVDGPSIEESELNEAAKTLQSAGYRLLVAFPGGFKFMREKEILVLLRETDRNDASDDPLFLPA